MHEGGPSSQYGNCKQQKNYAARNWGGPQTGETTSRTCEIVVEHLWNRMGNKALT